MKSAQAMQEDVHSQQSLAANVSFQELSNAIRALSMDAVERAQSGHPGMPMGFADVATILYRDFLTFDPEHPEWPNRDRLVLSVGHGSMLLYSLLYLTGYPGVTLEEIKNFRQLGAKTAGHPEYGHMKGVETTTGPLGQGLANAVGMALAERMMQARVGGELVDHYTYAIVGDGCLMEGISQEAISLAGHLNLHKLIVLFDDNRISIDGPTSLTVSEDTCKRFEACGFDVQAIDGHDPAAIHQAIAQARASHKPSFIACRTTIAFGAPTKAGKASSHGAPLGKDEIDGARKNLHWNAAPFELPPAVLAAWRAVGKRHANMYAEWDKREREQGKGLVRSMVSAVEAVSVEAAVREFKRTLAEKKPTEATRKSSQEILEVLNPLLPQMIGGSADLSGSNNTKTTSLQVISKENFGGRYIHYGVREHAMAAIMNGLALHGEFIPYGGTFLVFTDYCRPSIRLSALMGLRVIYVMTHDSIGVGEDGPTHQPIEHLAALRAIPNLQVMRPCDATETAECWQLALGSTHAPTVLCLTRQNLPALRTTYSAENLCAKGAYVLAEQANARVTLIGTGSEVMLAMQAKELLQKEGIAARVVSMPSTTLFDRQPKAYQEDVLGKGTLKVAVEAASAYGWERYVGQEGVFVGMQGFGASGPAPTLYKHFGITAEAIVERVKEAI